MAEGFLLPIFSLSVLQYTLCAVSWCENFVEVFLQSFGRFVQNSVDTVLFHKNFALENFAVTARILHKIFEANEQ